MISVHKQVPYTGSTAIAILYGNKINAAQLLQAAVDHGGFGFGNSLASASLTTWFFDSNFRKGKYAATVQSQQCPPDNSWTWDCLSRLPNPAMCKHDAKGRDAKSSAPIPLPPVSGL